MKIIVLLAVLLIVLSAVPVCAAEILTSTFVDSNGDSIGTATLTPMENGTLITVDLDLPEGAHAMHIHEKAQCDAPDFKSAGGHFNPEGHKHGFNSANGFHAGDLPNLYVESTGHIKAEIFSSRLHLNGKDSITKGTAIVIHEKADDYSTDPAGNAGNRIACAPIKQ